MRYWIITDTHFGHENIKKYCGRPDNFEDKILANITRYVASSDLIIHLGDFCFGNDGYWHNRFMKSSLAKKWLVMGNHDVRPASWYLSHGWHFAGELLQLKIYGYQILFSHIPQKDTGYSLNIHGHFHNSNHRRHEPYLQQIKNDKHCLVAIENTNYQPVRLKKIIEKSF